MILTNINLASLAKHLPDLARKRKRSLARRQLGAFLVCALLFPAIEFTITNVQGEYETARTA